MLTSVNPQEALKNHLLAALPANEFIYVISNLEPVYFKLGEVIYDVNERVDYLYFPTTVIVSLLHFLENGATTGVGVVGNEGVVGFELFLGGETTPCKPEHYSIATVQAGVLAKRRETVSRFRRLCSV